MDKLKEIILHIDNQMSKYGFESLLDIDGTIKSDYVFTDKNIKTNLSNFNEKYDSVRTFWLKFWSSNHGGTITFSSHADRNTNGDLHVNCYFSYLSKFIKSNDYTNFDSSFKSYKELDEFIPKLIALQDTFEASNTLLKSVYADVFNK